jgi:hypothetical protein
MIYIFIFIIAIYSVSVTTQFLINTRQDVSKGIRSLSFTKVLRVTDKSFKFFK